MEGGGGGGDRSNLYKPPKPEGNRESYYESRLPPGAGATRRWGSNDAASSRSEDSRGEGGRKQNDAPRRRPEGIDDTRWRSKSSHGEDGQGSSSASLQPASSRGGGDEGSSSASWLRASSRGGGDEGRDARAAASIVPRVGIRSELHPNRIEIPYSFKKDILSKPSQVIDLDAYRMPKPMDDFCVEIMQNVHHRNILHMESELRDGSIVVEAVTGKLDQEYIIAQVKCELHPLAFLQHIVWQMIKGNAELAYCGYYHGNLENAVPFYTLEKKVSGYPHDRKQPFKQLVLKLTDFKRAVENDAHAAQQKDQYSIGKWIEKMVSYLKEVPEVSSLMAELADLGQVLKKALTDIRTPKEWEEIGLNHHFFWGKGERTQYLTNFIPKLIVESKAFRKEIKKEPQLDTPWGGENGIHTGFYGLVAAMNKYRTEKLKVSTYKRESKKDYVKFACGCYIHEDQLKKDITHEEQCVDAVFRKLDVDLVQKLVLIHRRSLSRGLA